MCRFVRKLKDRNVCCCKYDVEMRYLLDALRRVRQKKHEDCECRCTLCRPSPGDTSCKIHEKVRKRVAYICGFYICNAELLKLWPWHFWGPLERYKVAMLLYLGASSGLSHFSVSFASATQSWIIGSKNTMKILSCHEFTKQRVY